MNVDVHQVMNLVGQLGGDHQQAAQQLQGGGYQQHLDARQQPGPDGYQPGQDDAGQHPDSSGAGYGQDRQGEGDEQDGAP